MRRLDRIARYCVLLGLVAGIGCDRAGAPGLLRGFGNYIGCEPRHLPNLDHALVFGYDGVLGGTEPTRTAKIEFWAGKAFHSQNPADADLSFTKGEWILLVTYGAPVTATIGARGVGGPQPVPVKITDQSIVPHAPADRFQLQDWPAPTNPPPSPLPLYEGIRIERASLSTHFVPLTL